jgi:hypothetical protein
MHQLMRLIRLEVSYQTWTEHLRKLNHNVVYIDGIEVSCHGIVPTREEFIDVAAVLYQLHNGASHAKK